MSFDLSLVRRDTVKSVSPKCRGSQSLVPGQEKQFSQSPPSVAALRASSLVGRNSQVSLPQVSRLSEPRPWSGETIKSVFSKCRGCQSPLRVQEKQFSQAPPSVAALKEPRPWSGETVKSFSPKCRGSQRASSLVRRNSQVSLPQVSRPSEPRPWSGETVNSVSPKCRGSQSLVPGQEKQSSQSPPSVAALRASSLVRRNS